MEGLASRGFLYNTGGRAKRLLPRNRLYLLKPLARLVDVAGMKRTKGHRPKPSPRLAGPACALNFMISKYLDQLERERCVWKGHKRKTIHNKPGLSSLGGGYDVDGAPSADGVARDDFKFTSAVCTAHEYKWRWTSKLHPFLPVEGFLRNECFWLTSDSAYSDFDVVQVPAAVLKSPIKITSQIKWKFLFGSKQDRRFSPRMELHQRYAKLES